MSRLLLVDDHASSRQPLALLLSLALEFDEIVQTGTIAEATALIPEIDVAIVDLGLPDGDGTALIARIRTSAPHTGILVLTSSSDRDDAARAIAAGAQGVVHKAADLGEIIAAVRAITAGESIVTPQQRLDLERLRAAETADLARPPRPIRPPIRLTPRERDVLARLAEGLSDKEIAARLGIGIETVRTHLAGIYGKFGVESRLQALSAALREGVIEDGRPDSHRPR